MKKFNVEKSTEKYGVVNCFEDLTKHNIKVGKSNLTFNYGIYKIKLPYKNKSLVEICNKLNYDYGFGILCIGVDLYVEYRDFEYYCTPKVDKSKMIKKCGTYVGFDTIKVNLNTGDGK